MWACTKNGQIFKRNDGEWKMVQGANAKRISVGSDGLPWIVNAQSQIFSFDGEGWKQQPGSASDIGVGYDGSVWVISNQGAEENGKPIFMRKMNIASKWQRINGGASNISVDQSGNAYVVNAGGRIFIHNGKRWRVWSGRASDIGVSPEGEFWVTNKSQRIYRWIGGSSAARYRGNGGWRKVNGRAVRVAVGPGQGNAYVVNQGGNIYNFRNNRWRRLPGKAKDVGVGADNTLWVIGSNKESGGYGIYKFNHSTNKWKKIPGSAVRIDVDKNGNAWVTNNKKQIYAHNGKKWIRQPGAANDIGVGADGTIWAIGTNKVGGGYGIYRKATGAFTTQWNTMSQ